ncbi:MAG: hypothetical protein WD898_02480 [Candidatus Paceibacterota bacterium]
MLTTQCLVNMALNTGKVPELTPEQRGPFFTEFGRQTLSFIEYAREREHVLQRNNLLARDLEVLACKIMAYTENMKGAFADNLNQMAKSLLSQAGTIRGWLSNPEVASDSSLGQLNRLEEAVLARSISFEDPPSGSWEAEGATFN